MITTIDDLNFEKKALFNAVHKRIKEYGLKPFCLRYGRNQSFIGNIINKKQNTTFETLVSIYEQTQELFSNRSAK